MSGKQPRTTIGDTFQETSNLEQQVIFMYVHRIEFSFQNGQTPEKAIEFAECLLGTLLRNGQICESIRGPLYMEENHCVAIVLAPEQESLDPKFHGKYVTSQIQEGVALGIGFTSTAMAKDRGSAETCSCHSSSGYVLFTTYLSLEPPVRCLDCFLPVPLYKFPAMPSGEYGDVVRWQSDYQSCDSLQMHCTVLERATIRQMSDPRSSLSMMGRENCRMLEDLSGKPFYYYLYRDHGRSVKSEKARRCPSCGQPWCLETPLHSLFDYKCDTCRLLSNFAWNLT
ncbi:MAG: Zn-ribbon-containing protein [Azoarcus sp.]|jgi:predicted  nucleic acid-binding Zn ribbon protein|nr:Zn-ribbon-containing protein [Azoarcus sp.]